MLLDPQKCCLSISKERMWNWVIKMKFSFMQTCSNNLSIKITFRLQRNEAVLIWCLDAHQKLFAWEEALTFHAKFNVSKSHITKYKFMILPAQCSGKKSFIRKIFRLRNCQKLSHPMLLLEILFFDCLYAIELIKQGLVVTQQGFRMVYRG